MRALHGITERSQWALSLLKRQSLLVDKWYLVPPEKSRFWKEVPLSDVVTNELEFLIDRGIVEEVPPAVIDECRQHHIPGLRDSILGLASNDARRLIQIANETWGGDGDLREAYALAFYGMADARLNQFMTDFLIRRVAVRLARNSNADIAPLYQIAPYAFRDAASNAHTVLRVALQSLPVPARDSPWQDILELRADLHDKLWGFRRFLSSLATKRQREVEVRDELEWTLNEYRNAMALHRLKSTQSVVDVYVIPALEVVEDLIKFNWTKLAKGALSVSKRKIDLMEAEKKADGRECAYLFDLQGMFGAEEEAGIFQLLEPDTRGAIKRALEVPEGYYDDFISASLREFAKTEFGK